MAAKPDYPVGYLDQLVYPFTTTGDCHHRRFHEVPCADSAAVTRSTAEHLVTALGDQLSTFYGTPLCHNPSRCLRPPLRRDARGRRSTMAGFKMDPNFEEILTKQVAKNMQSDIVAVFR